MAIGPMVDGIKQLLSQHEIVLSDQDWRDRYIVGYYTGATMMFLKTPSGGQLSGESLGMVMGWGWNELTGMPSLEFLQMINELSTSKDSEYQRGSDGGVLCAALMSKTARRGNPAVDEAMERGRLSGGAMNRALGLPPDEFMGAASYVFTRDFFGHVRHLSQAAA